MVLVMKELKVLGLGPELAITPEPLPSKEAPMVGIIKTLHSSITPRFSYGDEDYLDPQRKAEPEDDAKGTRVAVASPKAELVVDLEKVRDAHRLPTTDQSQGHRLIVFSSLGVDKDTMTVEIHDMKRKEAAVVLDVSRSQEICLMDVVESQGLGKVGVFHSLGGIRSFF